MLKGGSAVAAIYAVLATVVLSRNPVPTTVLLLKSGLLFELIAVLAAVVSIVLFGTRVRHSPMGATMAGIACVVAARPLPLVASEVYPVVRSYLWIDGDIAGQFGSASVAVEWDIFIVVSAHLATLFLPEVAGGLCGHAVFRSQNE